MKKNNVITDLNSKERIILSLPKRCDCPTCEDIKESLKKEVGIKRFRLICNVANVSI